MTRAALLTLLILVPLASRPAAQTPCLNRGSCGRPPCAFLAEIMLATARVRALQGGAQQLSNQQSAAIEPLMAAVNQAYGSYFQCAAKLPDIYVNAAPRCELGVRDERGRERPFTSVDAYIQATGVCSELTAATSKMQEVACETPSNRSLTNAQLKLKTEQAKLDVLTSSLGRYLNSCAPDATLDRQLSLLGLDALKESSAEIREKYFANRKTQNAAYDPADFSMSGGR